MTMLSSHRLSTAARRLRRPCSAITQAAAAPSVHPLRTFQTLASLPSHAWRTRVGGQSSWLDDASHNYDQYNYNPHLDDYRYRYHALQQVRWKRHSGSSGDSKRVRRPSKAQKKRFRKRIERERDLEKHAAPGSKAGPRREFHQEFNENLLNEYRTKLELGTKQYELQKELPPGSTSPLEDPALDYTMDDALLDDLVGNSTKGMNSQPTPEPVYYGDRQRQFYTRVANQMDIYREELAALPPGRPAPTYLLPTDMEIAGALKAYRDQQGTRAKPIGIAKALQHVLKDMGIPSTSVFKEYTYNALLSCCRTPKEGIRVFDLMRKQQHEISAYSWSILVDVHAKVGDFEGAERALDEMKAEGHPPGMAAYTSFLAACYKVCKDGRIAHSIRAKAGKAGWEKWQELRIRGLDPDAMCYGAMLRLCEARGTPERAYGLLEEMPRFEVKPTTLCFTSALKAVARSHETAIRYERGYSKKNRRRERIAAHHGNLARNIVLRAEQAEVEIDEGFVAALQLCAAAAGDSATAKAVYLAHQVRKNMKHWRQIGDDAHLARLRGENPDFQEMLAPGVSSSASMQIGGRTDGGSAIALRQSGRRQPLNYFEREYGQNDTRTLSAILRACAQAANSNGVGTIWSGRQNDGYLDADSLRLIQQYRIPEMRNTDIPGKSRFEVGMGALVNLEDMQNPTKRNDPFLRRGGRKKFPGVVTLDDVGTGLDDLPSELDSIYFDEDGMLKQKYIDSGLYPEFERFLENERYLEAREIAEEERAKQLEASGGVVQQIESGLQEKRWKSGDEDKQRPIYRTWVKGQVKAEASEAKVEDEVEWYFDSDIRKWSTRPKGAAVKDRSKISTKTTASDALKPSSESNAGAGDMENEEWFFDNDIMRWKTRPKQSSSTDKPSSSSNATTTVNSDLSSQNTTGVDDGENEEWIFDNDTMRWKTRPKQLTSTDKPKVSVNAVANVTPRENMTGVDDGGKEEWFFDSDAMRWSTRSKQLTSTESKLTEFEIKALQEVRQASHQHKSITSAGSGRDGESISETGEVVTDGSFATLQDEEAFQVFFSQLQKEIEESGEDMSVDQSEARELYAMMKAEHSEMGNELEDRDSVDNLTTAVSQDVQEPEREDSDLINKLENAVSQDTTEAVKHAIPTLATGRAPSKEFADIMNELKDEWGDDRVDDHDWDDTEDLDEADADQMSARKAENVPKRMLAKSEEQQNTVTAVKDTEGDTNEIVKERALATQTAESPFLDESMQDILPDELDEDFELEELRQLIPGLPLSRLRKVKQAYKSDLSDPSLLTLVPLLRERMPDWYTANSIRKANTRNADFVMEKAKKEGVVDIHLLNGMLQLHCAAGSLNTALDVYDQFQEYRLKPTQYSNRLVIQMFLKQKRPKRCLEFKQRVEDGGQKLDVLSYGSLIEYYSKHHQLGSALMMLKECIAVTGSPPGESYLKLFRILCRQDGLEEKLQVEEMIGKDPIEWLRHGEAVLKREYSKKGNRDINLANNALS